MMENLGNLLHRITFARGELFARGEFAALTYRAFDIDVSNLNQSEEVTMLVSYPVGLRPDKQMISSTRKYQKYELIGR